VLDFAHVKWGRFTNPLQVEITEKGKTGLIRILQSTNNHLGNGFGWPASVSANPQMTHGMPEQVPPVNPPLDTPAFYRGLVNAPTMMPVVVPSHTLPGSGFGQDQVVVPLPAAAWLFGSGLLALLSMARYRRH
jgi:hypothetical protein